MKNYLPRFNCPKSMTSKVYINKKTKASFRRSLNVNLRRQIADM